MLNTAKGTVTTIYFLNFMLTSVQFRSTYLSAPACLNR